MADLFSKQYKIATTLWILSSNDNVPQMTIEGVLRRTSDFTKDEIIDAVEKHPELFQRHIPKRQLEKWKQLMLSGKKRSKWIASSENREDVINKLTVEDLFRNRLRTSIDAEPINVEKLQWGLNHLMHIYSLELKHRESKNQWWKFILLPLLSILLTALTVILNYSNQRDTLEFQHEESKKLAIQPIYASFMESLNKTQYSIIENDKKITASEVYKLNSIVSQLYPYFEDTQVQKINDKVNEYGFQLLRIVKDNNADSVQLESIADQYVDLRKEITRLVEEQLK